MYTSKEILEGYKKELKIYKKWTDEMNKHYGKHLNPLIYWNDVDYQRLCNWNDCIHTLERILGLSEEEISEYSREVGIV
jgi:hypothetical protein